MLTYFFVLLLTYVRTQREAQFTYICSIRKPRDKHENRFASLSCAFDYHFVRTRSKEHIAKRRGKNLTPFFPTECYTFLGGRTAFVTWKASLPRERAGDPGTTDTKKRDETENYIVFCSIFENCILRPADERNGLTHSLSVADQLVPRESEICGDN